VTRPAAIRTARLTLETMSLEVMELLHGGARDEAAALLEVTFPEEFLRGEERWLEFRIPQLRKDPWLEQWLMRVMVTAERVVVGNCGFHDRPDASGMAEIGYSVDPACRRQGYAEEAARGLIDFAFMNPSVSRVRASVSPLNEPSLALVRKVGFVRVGTQIDEIDGEETVFEIARAAWPRTDAMIG